MRPPRPVVENTLPRPAASLPACRVPRMAAQLPGSGHRREPALEFSGLEILAERPIASRFQAQPH